MNPTFAITDWGIDTNVFNTVNDPKRDFTMTVSPGLDTWVSLGRSRWSVRGKTDLAYFQKYSSERSVDGGVAARLELPFNRVSPWAEGGTSSARQRAGYEIDVRSRRRVDTIGLGLDYRLAPKTTIALALHRDDFAWHGDEFLGNNLRESLDHRSDVARLAYRQAITPLTTFVVESDVTRDRFDYSTFRNSDSLSGLLGFDIKPFALISGSGRIGVRNFEAVTGGFQPFSGVVATADAAYVFRGSTQISVRAGRDIRYSFEHDYPYFVETGGTATLTQKITTVWDIQATVGRQNLAYRIQEGIPVSVLDRVDRVGQVGLGVGYHLRPGVRLALGADKRQRMSAIQQRQYDAFKFGVSVTYAQ